MDWSEAILHVIDFEGSRTSGIVEFGVVTVRKGAIGETATRLCKPKGPITALETSQHGIHELDTEDAAPFSIEFERFAGLRRTGVLVAHNASVEAGLLRDVWAVPPPVPDLVKAGREVNDWGPWIDTCQIYQRLRSDAPNHKLGTLIDLLGVRAELTDLAKTLCPEGRRKPHCALYDALGTALILLKLDAFGETTAPSLEWLITESAASSGERAVRRQGELDL